MNLKQKIQKLCAERKKTLKEFEVESGVGLNQTAKWDKSAPSIDKVVKAANYFGVSVDYLIRDSGENSPPQGDGLSGRIAGLDAGLQRQLIEFVELAQANPETAKRFLSFALGELRSSAQGR